MAIQVNGTTVIDNSRNVSNVGTVTATSFTGSGANLTGLPEGAPFAPDFDPSTTPDVTLTSSGTWTKPASVTTGSWVTIVAVGGGGARKVPDGSWGNSGGGGCAVAISLVPDSVTSIAFTVGAGVNGGSSSDGGNTTFTVYGVDYIARGGISGTGAHTQNYTPVDPNGTVSIPSNGKGAAYVSADGFAGNGSYSGLLQVPNPGGYHVPTPTFGGGGGAGGFSPPNPNPGGVSTYSGNGGSGQPSTGSATNGGFPGGGGGGSASNISLATAPGNGANGSVRIWYG